ncbi:hypothetical protein DU475_02685 [Rhodopseudomonas sp. WA056]|nr:hypothetical protein [Rhodopseudomonas sp. WA056]
MKRRLLVDGAARRAKGQAAQSECSGLRRAGKGNHAVITTVAANADQRARDLAPVVADIRTGGAVTLQAIA